MKNFTIIFLISILATACSSTNNLIISVTEPAPVTLPGNIKNVGILNRANSSASDKNLEKLDKILSLELFQIDSLSSIKTIEGLHAELSKNSRFNKVKNIKNIALTNTSIKSFSPVLPAQKIKAICLEHGLDAIFVLEYFDTETKVEYSVIPTTVNAAGVKIKVAETQAKVLTFVWYGWRIYDAAGEVIYDQYADKHNVVSTGRGLNPMKALSAVTGQKNAVINSAYKNGGKYGLSILPYKIRVSRIYYVRGTDNFKTGKRRAQTGDWDGAAELWKLETTNAKAKIAGRAYYNMAIINEINGNLDDAIDWAKKSYSDYGNKKALYYVNVLKNRKEKNRQLEIQQSE